MAPNTRLLTTSRNSGRRTAKSFLLRTSVLLSILGLLQRAAKAPTPIIVVSAAAIPQLASPAVAAARRFLLLEEEADAAAERHRELPPLEFPREKKDVRQEGDGENAFLDDGEALLQGGGDGGVAAALGGEGDPGRLEMLVAAKPSMRLTEIWGNGQGTLSAFAASLTMIVFSELGDKTFFIAALMAMRHRCFVVFAGAMSALGLMTLLSVVVGSALPAFLDKIYTHYASVALFFVFGIKMAYEAYHMEAVDGAENLAEVEAELDKKDDYSANSFSPMAAGTAGDSNSSSPTDGPPASSSSSSSSSSAKMSTAFADGEAGASSVEMSVVSITASTTMTTTATSSTSAAFSGAAKGAQQSSSAVVDLERGGEQSKVSKGRVASFGGRKSSDGVMRIGGGGGGSGSSVKWFWSFLRPDRACGNLVRQCISAVFIQAFSLTFLAEWGDRSQIATIALAASKDPVGVTVGALLGHGLCTGMAVVGGRMLATKISERFVTFAGGALFIIFGMIGWMFGAS